MRIFVIGDPDTVAGMRLAGAAGRAASGRNEAKQVLEKALAEEAVALLLITRDLADLLREEVDRLKTERSRPIVVEIPSRKGALPQPKVGEIVKNAIGIAL